MTIVYPLTIPYPRFAQITYDPVDIQSVTRSGFSGARQIQVYPGEYWSAAIQWAPEHKTKVAAGLTAFLAALRGAAGTFLLPDPIYTAPIGAAFSNPGSPIVDGSGQKGTTLKIKGAPASVDGWLLSGSRIQGGPNGRCQLLMVLTDVNTDATGRATIDVWPRLRGGLIDNDAVQLSNPAALMALDGRYQLTASAPFRQEQSVRVAEAI